MGSWWRSEEMTYVSLILSEPAAPACISEIGSLGCMQFVDMSPELTPFQRKYVTNVKRCDEIERKIRYVNGEIKKMDVGINYSSAGALEEFSGRTTATESSGALVLEELDAKLDQYEQQLVELNKYGSKLLDEYNRKVELHHILTKVRTLLLAEMRSIESGGDELSDSYRSSAGVSMQDIGEYGGGSGVRELSFSNIAVSFSCLLFLFFFVIMDC